jgi:glycosyltransferase involved in cell wall biosynthesis
MKIAFIVPSLANKGPILVVRDLCEGYMLEGHTCIVFYFDNIVELNMPCVTRKISFVSKVNFSDFDIVHSHMYRPDAYVFFHKPLRKLHTKFFTTIHQLLYKQIPYDFNWLKALFVILTWHFFLYRFDSIITLCDCHLNYYKKFKYSNVSTIHNGRDVDKSLCANIEDLTPIDELRSKFKIIGSVAYMTKRKGLFQLVLALSYLKDYAAIFVGDGPDLVNLKKIAEDIGVSERCMWVGSRISGYRYMQYLDCFVMCSYAEGFPLALVEASSYGCPVVCPNTAIFRSILPQDVSSFYEIGNIDSLCYSVVTTMACHDFYSEKIYSYYKSFLTKNIMVDNYLDEYKKNIK